MDIVTKLSTIFWSTNFWLPPNTTWEEMTSTAYPDVQHADYKDLIWPLPLAAIVILIRYSLERFWIMPLGKSLGLKGTKPKKAGNIPALEKVYKQSTQLDRRKLGPLTKNTDMTERQIERWWRLRRAQDKPSTMTKFCETAWRCLYYSCSFTYGLLILWNKPWLWDFKSCWYQYPHHALTTGIWWYYMGSMSFYWSLTVTQFFDVKRKDFWQMFVHHLITLLLLSLSWISNFHRVGSLVLVIHDCADIFLEAAKLAKYTKYQKLCDNIFVIFTVLWIVSRLGFYPRLIYSSTFEYLKIMPAFPAYSILNALLIILLFLHLLWTYMIFKIIIDSVRNGFMTGDVRSSGSEVSESSETYTHHYAQNNDNNNDAAAAADDDVMSKRSKIPIKKD